MELEYPDDLRYMDSHEYFRLDGEIATIGLSAYAIDELGDVVFLELPEEGDSIEVGETIGSIESVKAVEDLYAPISGTVIERNETVINAPEVVTEDPYLEGWFIKVRVDNLSDEMLAETMTSEEYRAKVEGLDS